MHVTFQCLAVSSTSINFRLTYTAVDIAVCPEEQILNCNQPDADDGVGCENEDEEAVAMIEEQPSGVEMTSSQLLMFAFMCKLNSLRKTLLRKTSRK